jgi:hypothetical protein
MIVRLLAEALSRLTRYATLPCTTLRDRLNCLVSGLLNILLAMPSMRSPRVMRLYDVLCRKLAGKTWMRFHDYTVRSVDCEGMLVFHPLYEPEITRILLGILKPGYVFVDVGAHVGRYTLLAAKKVGADGLVIALEPIPETFQTLRENIEVNRVNNVVALYSVRFCTMPTRTHIAVGTG